MPAENFTRAQVALQNTPTVIYTAPANGAAIIKAMLITNVAGSQQSVQLWQGGSANANQILAPTALQTGEYGTYDGAVVVAPGETLQGQTSANNGATITVSGVELT